MTFTADEYRTAAKVFREEYETIYELKVVPSLSELLEEKADKADKRREYAVDLGLIGVTGSPETKGLLILGKLTQDGWRAPEGLF